MTSRMKRYAGKLALCLALGVTAGALMSDADAARQCRFQHCWDFLIFQYCYYDSGWVDC